MKFDIVNWLPNRLDINLIKTIGKQNFVDPKTDISNRFKMILFMYITPVGWLWFHLLNKAKTSRT